MVDTAHSLKRFVSEPIANESGIAAVEFAFLAPVALAFLSLAFAAGQGLSVYHQTVRTAHIVTDVVSRTAYTPDSSVANAEQLKSTALDGDLALGNLVMFPNDSTNLKIVMTELKLDPVAKTATVVWSEGYNGGVPLACAAVITLDPSYYQTGASYVLYGQATYTFQPLGGSFNLGPFTFNATEVLTIRQATQITVPGVQQQC